MFGVTLLALVLAGQQQPASVPQPPPDSPPLVRVIEIAFPNQGNVSVVEPETYLYYVQTKPSRPSAGEWVPYDRQTALDDFKRLWATGFLDDLSVEVLDEPYENGVVGKHIIFQLEERPRVRIIDFEGMAVLEQSKIDDALKEADVRIRVDSFLDVALVRKAERTLESLLREKGYQSAVVTHRTKTVGGGPKRVHLTFAAVTGPQVRIASVRFVGNKAFKDGTLAGRMKSNKARQWWLPSFLRRRGAFQPLKYEEDADLVVQHYRDRGYVSARVGEPELKTIRNSRDGKTRWVQLRVPVDEGPRYRVGRFTVEGNTVVKTDPLLKLFPLKAGQFYREAAVRKGLEKARELYGTGGYFEFTGYPDFVPRTVASPTAAPTTSGKAPRPPRPARRRAPRDAPAVLDVTMKLQEGKQYFVNRLAFKGNTVTRDNVIRRELALLEGAVFNTEALKYSVKRLNQLGYFKPMEDAKGIDVAKTPGSDNKVDVTLNVEEQNRNQIQFGAGMSQYDGLYGSVSYTAANFLGRGETVTVAAQRGSRSNVYQVGFGEPYLFDRPISASLDLYSQKYNYYLATDTVGYSEVREGAGVSVGRPVKRFSRVSLNYTYEVVHTSVSKNLLEASGSGGASGTSTAGLPWFTSYYDVGRHVDSRITPTLLHNTVDNPMMPHSGLRITGSVQMASRRLGGSYDYMKPEGEVIYYWPLGRRTGFGVRGQAGWLRPYGTTSKLPYYLRYFLGGEYQIRGVDIRTVGPMDANSRALGGNKFLLFNAEYYVDIAGPVRAALFHDAGQAFSEKQRMDLRQLRTSSGVEVRVIMPMLNVPFRLIWARNVYRDTFQPASAFKFAVGTTF